MYPTVQYSKIILPLLHVSLHGNLSFPDNATAIVIFAHGSGSGRNSPRNKMVAAVLNEFGFATLLFDLLTEEEDREIRNRFNIELLADRLTEVTHWLKKQDKYKDLSIGYFGASTGAAAAIRAAAGLPKIIEAIVSRGGRPDLAMDKIPKVTAPTLFIVGQKDVDVLHMNQKAYGQLTCEKCLEIVPGATHLFEEEGAMEKVSFLAAKWFAMHLHPLTITK